MSTQSARRGPRFSLGRWSVDHVFQLWTLPRAERRAVAFGLLIAGAGATAFLLAQLSAEASGRLNPHLVEHQTLHLATSIAAYVATGVGTLLVVVARPKHVRARRWCIGAGVVPALLLVAALLNLTATSGASGVRGLGAAAPIWLALGMLVGSWLAAEGSRWALTSTRVWILSVTFCAPLLAVLVASWGQRDPTMISAKLDGLVVILGFLAIPVALALLVLLGVEGLKLSGDLGVWCLRRPIPANVLLLVLAATKLVVLLAIGLYRAATRPSGGQSLPLTAGDVICGVVITLAVCWLLTQETRLGLGYADLEVAARGLGLLMAAIFLATIAVVGVILTYYVGRVPAVAVSMPAFAAIAGLTALIGTRVTSTVARRTCWLIGPLLGLVALLPYVTTDRSRPTALPTVSLSNDDIVLLAVYAVAILVLAIVFVLANRRLRPYRVFVIAVLGWLGICLGVAPLVPGGLRYAGTTVDLGLTAAVLLIALAHRWGRLRAVSTEELVLLLVTVTVVLEVPFAIQAIPERWLSATTAVAFLTPALAALTIESGSLNSLHPRRLSVVLGTVGAIAISYGTLYALADWTEGGPTSVQQLAGAITGLLGLPFAIVLVAVTSARLQTGRPQPRS